MRSDSAAYAGCRLQESLQNQTHELILSIYCSAQICSNIERLIDIIAHFNYSERVAHSSGVRKNNEFMYRIQKRRGIQHDAHFARQNI